MSEKFVPRNKMNKKARKELDASKRNTWNMDPVTQKIASAKRYTRKVKHKGHDYE